MNLLMVNDNLITKIPIKVYLLLQIIDKMFSLSVLIYLQYYGLIYIDSKLYCM